MGDTGKEPDISECSRIADNSESALSRSAGLILNQSLEEFGGLFFVQLRQTAYGGVVDVWHDNCRPERVANTSSNHHVRRFMEESFGPTALQLFIIGPELHAFSLHHVTHSDADNDTATDSTHDAARPHPCHYRLRYQVHTTGTYQLRLEWMYSDYHFFMENQPFWPRGLYGELFSPATLSPQNITASPILLPIPIARTEWKRELQRIREFDGAGNLTMALPETFTRLDPRFGPDRHYLQPQGQGRWRLRNLTLPGARPNVSLSNMFWQWRSFRSDQSAIKNKAVVDLHDVLCPLPDCYFADVDEYEYVTYAHELWHTGQLAGAALHRYRHVAAHSLEAHPSVPPLTLPACLECLRGLSVALIGDSHTRKLFNEFIPHVLNVQHFRAVKEQKNTRPGGHNHTATATAAAGRRVLLDVLDSAIDTTHAYRAFQCLSKGSAYDGAQRLQKEKSVVEDACALQTGWPDGRNPIIQAALLHSDVLLYNFGHWQASNRNAGWWIMRPEHIHSWLTAQMQHWNDTHLTPDMHTRQADKWDATHQHLSLNQSGSAANTANATAADESTALPVSNPFRYSQSSDGRLVARVVGSLTLLDVAREKMLWWSPEVFASNHNPSWFRDIDGRSPQRLQLYSHVQRAVMSEWGIRQYSDTSNVGMPFRNCVLKDDMHAIEPVYEAQLPGILDKIAQMRGCSTRAD